MQYVNLQIFLPVHDQNGSMNVLSNCWHIVFAPEREGEQKDSLNCFYIVDSVRDSLLNDANNQITLFSVRKFTLYAYGLSFLNTRHSNMH